MIGNDKPKLLDLFCGGGGASMGYHRAGFDVTGVDKYAQPEYPFTFIMDDWRNYVLKHWHEYDIIHASPVCKGYANVASNTANRHPREISRVRTVLTQLDMPYVIENVESARWALRNPIMLCGSSFQLRTRRHRLFESNVRIQPLACDHDWQQASKIYLRRGRYSAPTKSGVCPVNGDGMQLLNVTREQELALRQEAMGIDWLPWTPLTQAIQPAFTEYIGKQLLESWLPE